MIEREIARRLARTEEEAFPEWHGQMSGPVFKAHDDPRLTAVGRLLRKLSLDELPED